jgi:hypothetical protein
MAIPERDTVYTNDGTNRTVYTRESSSTGWFVGIIVALALLAIGYLVFSANSGPAPSTSVDVNNTPAVSEPAPMTPAPATGAGSATPMVESPAPAEPATPPADATPAAPADTAPATTAPAPAAGG